MPVSGELLKIDKTLKLLISRRRNPYRNLLPLHVPYSKDPNLPPETDIVLRSPDILMMVASRTDSFARRNVLRKTWMNKNYSEIVRDGRMKALFLVGMVSEDYRVRRIVMEEAKLYGDMVVIDLEDTYDDLPFKSLSLLLYAVSKAPEFKVIGKIDEDVMFFPDKLIPLLDGKVIDPDAAAFYGQLPITRTTAQDTQHTSPAHSTWLLGKPPSWCQKK